MARSRYGNGRHRQAWIVAPCPFCDQEVEQRRTLPGHPMHIKTHMRGDDFCPPLGHGRRSEQTTIVHRRPRPPAIEGQITLFG